MLVEFTREMHSFIFGENTLVKDLSPARILSNLNLKRIQTLHRKNMNEVETLDIPGNRDLDIKEIFNSRCFTKQKNLPLDNCGLRQQDLKALALNQSVRILRIRNIANLNSN